ncbi:MULTISPECIES: large conductance mechanosensitive channel protein MscL [Deinococcus]|uniref:Large-conductance mechanosensitive channel n=1 Tax=Deinococcus daejeonensis TaxID=1007098 RepID=A0ABQ2J8Q2_9DEIO|nr:MULTISPECIES: large conductance mechanosensitive channel protein MscL [Deinococcus]RIY08681.1 large conductance mechanosensitive channel protein MscL [Deinococcus sp. RM]GGN41947.1 large-conductance mechanosensitive channel [Deinococcus daejeonensis]
MISGFQKFLLRGNLIDLAVGVLIGAAFGKVVDTFTKGVIMPIIGIFGSVPNFDNLKFSVNGSEFLYGQFLTALISFLITATVIYFFVITPFNRLMERFKREEKPAVAEPSNEEKLLAEIRDELRRRP